MQQCTRAFRPKHIKLNENVRLGLPGVRFFTELSVFLVSVQS